MKTEDENMFLNVKIYVRQDHDQENQVIIVNSYESFNLTFAVIRRIVVMLTHSKI